MQLRPYQQISKDRIRELFGQGKKRVMLVMPTGAGKTVTFADIVSDTVKNGGKAIIVVDRKELLEQAKEKLIEYGLTPSLITAGRRGKLNAAAYIATVQTLIRRTFPDVDLIIIDEAHKQTFDKLFERPEYKDKYVIPVTATPIRTGRMNQLSDFYEEMVEATNINELIADGFLVPGITYGAKMDMKGVKMKGGDFDEKEMYEKVFNKPQLYEGVVEQYKKFANNTRAVCFNINVKHSKATCDAFNAHGIPAYHLDGSLSKVDREKIIRGHKNGFFKVLCNCDILTTGYDDFQIETVIVNRATKSLSLWLQMCGRGSRPTPLALRNDVKTIQKSHFNLIDMGGNTYRLGFWQQDRTFSLTHDVKEKVDAAPVKVCPDDQIDEQGKPGCGALIPTSRMVCKEVIHGKECGYIFPVKVTEMATGEFLPIEYENSLPPDLIGTAWGSLSLQDLERVRVAKGYQLGWIAKQIMLRQDLHLLDYANMREFKNPEGWVKMIMDRQNKIN